MSKEEFRGLLKDKIDALNLPVARADIDRFIPDPKQLNNWSKQYFHDLAAQLIIAEPHAV